MLPLLQTDKSLLLASKKRSKIWLLVAAVIQKKAKKGSIENQATL